MSRVLANSNGILYPFDLIQTLYCGYWLELSKSLFENIVGKGENDGTSISSFSHNVFYPMKDILIFRITFCLWSANAVDLEEAVQKIPILLF